jgi:hypothetical protein
MSGYYPDGCTQAMLDRWLDGGTEEREEEDEDCEFDIDEEGN